MGKFFENEPKIIGNRLCRHFDNPKDEDIEEKDEVWGSEVITGFYGNEDWPIEWNSPTEKKVFFVKDDMHVPQPISPLYASTINWCDNEIGASCAYMYRRFSAPIGTEWPSKVVNYYLYHGMVPPNPEKIEQQAKIYEELMPVYADEFLELWDEKYLPWVKESNEYFDNYPYEDVGLKKSLILFEEALDYFNRLWEIHWILNLAQFQAFQSFKGVYGEVFGEVDNELTDRILVSIDDKNWDSQEGLWKMKKFISKSDELTQLFKSGKSAREILSEIENAEEGDLLELNKRMDEFLDEFGWKAIYAHELKYPSWREDPLPVIEQLRTYLEMDYHHPTDVENTKKDREEAIEEVWERAEQEGLSQEEKEKLENSMKQAINMAPLTPNHHFYLDQGGHQRVRKVALAVGRKMVEHDILEDAEDVVYLTYEEMKEIGIDSGAFDAKSLVNKRKKEMEEAKELVPPQFIGTVTDWGLNQEPYKQGIWGWSEEKLQRAEQRIKNGNIGRGEPAAEEIKGIPASPGVVEGEATVVLSPDEFDKVKDGSIMICDMTNPAWVSVFPKLKAVVTDAGGALAHPAIVSREFGIPCVVGTMEGTKMIQDGQRIRVNGNTGSVEILE